MCLLNICISPACFNLLLYDKPNIESKKNGFEEERGDPLPKRCEGKHTLRLAHIESILYANSLISTSIKQRRGEAQPDLQFYLSFMKPRNKFQ